MVTPDLRQVRWRNVVMFNVEPEQACAHGTQSLAHCVSLVFDGEAERSGVRYQFVDRAPMSCRNATEPSRRYGRKQCQLA